MVFKKGAQCAPPWPQELQKSLAWIWLSALVIGFILVYVDVGFATDYLSIFTRVYNGRNFAANSF